MMNKYMESLASNYKKIIIETKDLNLLKVKENSKGEIIGMDYDLSKIYTLSENLTEYLDEQLKGNNGYFKDAHFKEGNLFLFIPLGQLTNNLYLSFLGPKIPVIVRLENSFFTNVKTKVTDYGINNALLNIILEVKLNYHIITPLKEENETFFYELMLSSNVIEGKVPQFYGGYLENKSAFLEVYFPH